MKKKQKQKLLNQFRPSLDGIRSQLFHSLEDESLRRYGLPLQVMLDPKDRHILTIGLAGKTNEDTRINVPIDDNFTTNSLFNCYKNFHGQVVELIGEYDLVFDEFSYNREMKKLLKEKGASK